jgi:hypothetical protein
VVVKYARPVARKIGDTLREAGDFLNKAADQEDAREQATVQETTARPTEPEKPATEAKPKPKPRTRTATAKKPAPKRKPRTATG